MKYRQMQFFLSVVLAGQVFFAAAAAAQSAQSGQVVDMIAASVDGDPLTLGDLRRYIAAKGEAGAVNQAPDSPEMRSFLRDMVLDAIVAKEAKEAGISISNEEVEAYITEIKKQNRVDDAGFLRLLAQRGISLDDYKPQVRADILRARLVSTKVRSKINVIDEDIDRYVAEHPELIPPPGTVHLKQITMRPEPGREEDAAEELADMRRRIAAGGDWVEIGGRSYVDLGYVKPEDLRESLQRTVAKLKIGQVSGIIRGEGTLSILGLIGKSDESGGLDQAAKEQIRTKIYQAKFAERVEKYLNDELPKKYSVEIKM